MNQDTPVYIAYIACHLISGKKIASLYDLVTLNKFEITSMIDIAFLREFDEKFMDYMPGYASDCRCTYTAGNGHSIEIFINGRTFIVHILGTPSYFIGNVQGDTIYVYDHDNSAHYKYRIIGCVEGQEKSGKAVGAEIKEEKRKSRH